MSERKRVTKKIHIERILWDSTDFRVSYQTIIETLAHDIQKAMDEESVSFDFICGIPRGGMIPAVSLAHILEIPIMEFCDERIHVNNILFVDDIVHSGRTAVELPQNHSVLRYKTVSVVKNEIASDDVIWKCGIEVGKNVWVKFPWESEITIQQAIKKMKAHNSASDLDDE